MSPLASKSFCFAFSFILLFILGEIYVLKKRSMRGKKMHFLNILSPSWIKTGIYPKLACRVRRVQGAGGGGLGGGLAAGVGGAAVKVGEDWKCKFII